MPGLPEQHSLQGRVYWQSYGLENPYSGIGSYARQLYSALGELGISPQLWANHQGVASFDSLNSKKSSLWSRLVEPDYSAKILIQNHLESNQIAKGPLILHAHANYNSPRYLRSPLLRKIVTLHDLIPAQKPRVVSRASYHLFRMLARPALLAADQIICVSAWTRDQLCQWLPQLEAKTLVLRHGWTSSLVASDMESRSKHRQSLSQKPKVMLVSRWEPYKRMDLLCSIVKNAQSKYEFLVVTDAKGSAFVRKELSGLQNHDLRCFTSIGREQMQSLYCQSDLLINTSLYEGFCLPVLEALELGTPAIYTLGSGMDEWVPEELSIGLDPQMEVGDWLEAIDRMLNQRPLDEAGMQRGLGQLQKVLPTWAEAAQKLISVYNELTIAS